MKIKKICRYLLISSLIVVLCGCSYANNRNFTFSIENGDAIKVSIDTKDGYGLSQKGGSFIVSKDDNTISQGVFLADNVYNQYKKLIVENTNNDVENVEKGTYNDNDYIYYETEGKSGREYNYIVKVKYTNTGVLIGSTVSKDEAQNAFKKLKIFDEIHAV